MKRIALVLMVLFIVSSLVVAQDSSPKSRSGDRAWLFLLGGLSDLSAGNYNGGVGLKYYIQDNIAFRGSLGFTKVDNPDQPAPATPTPDPSNFTVSGAILYNYATNGPVVAFFGGEIIYNSFNSGVQGANAVTTFGVAGDAGVEWFAWSNVSLSGEYKLSFISTGDPSTKIFNLGSASSSNLTVGVYF
jgi:opacity protein-like surface antigen